MSGRAFGSAYPDRRRPIFKHMADAVLAQAAAVQNTWYTILNTTRNAKIVMISVMMATADETLEVRITVDGNTYTTAGVNCTAGSYYTVWRDSTGSFIINATVAPPLYVEPLQGKSVKIEIRKTTAAGANTLNGRVCHEVIE